MFDQLLLDYANKQGVEVRQPCAIDRVQLAQENEVRVLTGAGPFSARTLVDATGRASWLSRRLGIARGARSPRLIARYGYAAGSCSGLDDAPELVGIPRDGSGPPWCSRDCTTGHVSQRMDLGLTRVGCRSICAGWRRLDHQGVLTSPGAWRRRPRIRLGSSSEMRPACSTRFRRRACSEPR